MKSTWFGSRVRYDFCRLVELGGGYSRMLYDSFDAWLKCSLMTLRQAANVFATGQMDDVIEAEILKIQNGAKDWPRWAEAFSVLSVGLEVEGSDFLGKCFQELSLNDKTWKGQCFTPHEVCLCMAEMTMHDVGGPVDGRTLWLSEPACGGGAMAIAASDVLKRKGFYPWHYHWHCVDLDWRCAAMTYIQMTLLGIPAVVVHGNSLTLEFFETWRNIISMMHPPKKDRPINVAEGPKQLNVSVSEAVQLEFEFA